MSSAISTITNTTTVSSAVRTKWELDLIKKAAGRLVLERFANTKVQGMGEGGTIRINRLLRVAKKTTADTQGTIYGHADAKALSTNYIDITPTKWGDSFNISEEASIDAFLSQEDYRQEIANQMARSMEYQVMKLICTGLLRHRIDADGTYQKSGTCTTASSTGVALYGASVLTEADDFWNGGYATITNPDGPGYDETSKVTDFATTGDVATVSFTNGLTTGSKYRITVGTNLAATDVLTTDGLLDVSAILRETEADPFAGGIFRGVITAAQERDLWDDTIWKTAAQYDDSGKYANYRLVRWAGHEMLITSEPYREDTDGTENQSTGVVYVSPFFGDKTYSIVSWNPMGTGTFGMEFVYKENPDSADLRNSFKAISWKTRWGGKVQRATNGVGLMTGATSLNILAQ